LNFESVILKHGNVSKDENRDSHLFPLFSLYSLCLCAFVINWVTFSTKSVGTPRQILRFCKFFLFLWPQRFSTNQHFLKTIIFASNAQVPPIIERERLVMEKSKNLFGRPNNEVRRSSADKATAFRTPKGEKRPCRRTHADQTLCVLCAISVKNSVNR
jgi:hypothetical protein